MSAKQQIEAELVCHNERSILSAKTTKKCNSIRQQWYSTKSCPNPSYDCSYDLKQQWYKTITI